MYVHFKNHPLPHAALQCTCYFRKSVMHTYVREACRAIFSFQSTRDKTKSALSEENDVFIQSGFLIQMVPECSGSLCSSQLSYLRSSSHSKLTGSTLRNVVHSSRLYGITTELKVGYLLAQLSKPQSLPLWDGTSRASRQLQFLFSASVTAFPCMVTILLVHKCLCLEKIE